MYTYTWFILSNEFLVVPRQTKFCRSCYTI